MFLFIIINSALRAGFGLRLFVCHRSLILHERVLSYRSRLYLSSFTIGYIET